MTFIYNGSSSYSYTLLSTFVQPVITVRRYAANMLFAFGLPSAGTYKLVISLSTTNTSTTSRSFFYSIESSTNVDSATYGDSHGQPGTSSDQLVYGSRTYEVVSSDVGDIIIKVELGSTASDTISLTKKLCANASIFSIV